MKKIIATVLCGILLQGVALAKSYTVIVSDEIVPYFEKSLDKDITPERWLSLQAINEADQQIDKEYNSTLKKTRDDKITELKK